MPGQKRGPDSAFLESYFLYYRGYDSKKALEDGVALITRTEEMLLLTVCKYDGDAYGMTIREEMQKLTGRRYSIGGIYVPLDRLVKKGLLSTYESGPTPERGGRAKRLFKVAPEGVAALREVRRTLETMWEIGGLATDG